MWGRRRAGWRSFSCVLAAVALLASGCGFFTDGGPVGDGGAKLQPIDPSRSLTADGTRMAESATLAKTAPRYHVEASVDPSTGQVDGTLWASIPVAPDTERLRFRFFAGLPSLDAAPQLGPARVEGTRREVRRSASVATVALPANHPDRVRIELPFSYTLREDTGSGDLLSGVGGDMSPAQIGLLSRHENAVNLGHWLPLWIPEGRSHDPRPDGFGDIGNFPSAVFSLELSVPDGWDVITGGFRTGEETRDGRTTVHAEGYGLRSLVASVVRGYASKQREVGGTTVKVYGPQAGRKALGQVLQTSTESLRVLEEAFGPYPWRELDVIAAPLGAGVGGMEWSGAVWIEPSIFAGRLPGMAALGDLAGGTGDASGQEGLFGGMLGDLGARMRGKMQGVRAWTVAHELGHQWWHIVVGNDSVQAPVVDEPLAQYSACLIMRRTRQGTTEQQCDPHIAVSYSQMRMLGASDAPALQRSDDFASSIQYSGVIYGKAPYLYLALEEEYGRDAVLAALREVTTAHAFEMISPVQLRRALGEALGDPSGVRRMWRHWLRETHGDADVGKGASGASALGDLFGELGGSNGPAGEGLSKKELQDLLDRLLDR